jgi:hypothetical protein
MRNASSKLAIANKGWTLNETGDYEAQKRKGLIAWWYEFTALPDAPINATFAQH